MSGLDSRRNWLFGGDKSATRSRGEDRSPSPTAAVDEAVDAVDISASESTGISSSSGSNNNQDDGDRRDAKRSRSRSPSQSGSSRGRASTRGRNRRSRSRRGRTASPAHSVSPTSTTRTSPRSVVGNGARAQGPLTNTQKRAARYKRAGGRSRGRRGKAVEDAVTGVPAHAPPHAPFGIQDIQRPEVAIVRVTLHTIDLRVAALLKDETVMATAGFAVERDADTKDLYVAVGPADKYLDFTCLLSNGTF